MECKCYDIENIPFDMLYEICRLSESLTLLTTSKILKQHLTSGVTLTFMEYLGYDVKVVMEIDQRQMLVWKLNGITHRIKYPAIEYEDGEKCWLQNGLLHREGGPAIEFPDGGERWYRHGRLHREDGPAVYSKNGPKLWYTNGKYIHQRDFNYVLDVGTPDDENLLNYYALVQNWHSMARKGTGDKTFLTRLNFLKMRILQFQESC